MKARPAAADAYEGLSAQDLLARLPHDAAVAEARRQGNPAQEPEPDLLPDQRRRARGGPGRGRHGPEARLRLVPPVLPRPRALPDARHDAARDAARRRSAPRTIRTRAAGRCRRTGATSSSTSSRSRAPPARSACTRSAPPKRAASTRRSTAIEGRESRFQPDEVTYVSIGEGATSEGEFWESLNTACTLQAAGRLPVEDNGYAISVPVEVQTPGGDISKLVASFPGLFVQSIDGTDFLASYTAMSAAVELRARAQGPGARPRQGHPPVLALALRRREAVQDARRSARPKPSAIRLRGSRRFLASEGHRDRSRARRQIVREVEARSERRGRRRRSKPRSRRATPPRSTSTLPTSIPTSAAFSTDRDAEGKPDTMVAAINRTLKDEMARNPRIVVFGEDVADASREAALDDGAGQGRRVQGHARPAARVRQRPRVQLAARRGQHHRPRRRHGDARHQAGRRDPVLRLHLAGDDADARRDVDAALPLEQRVLVPDGHPRRRSAATCAAARRTTASRARASSRTARASASCSRRTRRTRPACCAPRSAATTRCCSSSTSTCIARPTTRASTPAADYMIPFGKAARPPRRHRRRRAHLGRAGAALAARRAAGGEGRHQRDGRRPAHDHAVRLGRRSPPR